MSTTLRLLFISMLLAGGYSFGFGQTIYIVRHAEKDLNSTNPKDPSLNTMGLARSYALRDKLKKIDLDAIYSTNFKRTRETGIPLANAKGLDIQTYDVKNLDSFAVVLKSEYKGRSVLIIGHSNTILETVRALGGTPTKSQIGDQDYSNLFIVKVRNSGRVQTKSLAYGD